MHDRADTLNRHPDHSLATALRGLPDATPQPDLWIDIARALEQRRTIAEPDPLGATRHAREPQRQAKPVRARPTWFVPAALAAGIALALLLPRGAPQHSQPDIAPPPGALRMATTQPVAPDHAMELDDLQQRSQALERWIGAASALAPQRSRDLMAAVEIEDLVGLVDVQLGAPHTADEALPLWRQRVALLEDLATIRGSAYAMAANDTDPRASHGSFNRIN